MGGSQSSDHTGNTAGRCDSVEEDPLLLWDEGKVLLMAIFTCFIPFLFWWTFLAAIGNPSPGAGTGVLEAAGGGNVLSVVEGLVWWLCWAG